MPRVPKPPPELPHVLIDQREQAPLRFSAAVTTESVLLPVGDYSIRGASEFVAIERKRNNELQTCCGTDRPRFIEQMERLRKFPVRWLVIECTFDDIALGLSRSNINPLSVLGTLIKLGSDWHIPIMPCRDAAGAALFVERVLIREHKRLLEKAKAMQKMKETGT